MLPAYDNYTSHYYDSQKTRELRRRAETGEENRYHERVAIRFLCPTLEATRIHFQSQPNFHKLFIYLFIYASER